MADNPKNKGKKVATRKTADNSDAQEIGEIRNRSSPSRFIALNHKLASPQKIALIEKKFGGLLNIGACTMPLELIQWVIKCYDPDTSELIIPDRRKIPVDAESVHRIWGLPKSGLKVCYELNADITRQMMEDYGLPPNGSPDLTSWCKMIEEMGGKSDDMFVRAWAVMAYNFLAPITGLKVSPRAYPAVYDVDLIPRTNICQFVVDQIRIVFSSLKSKKYVCCCVYHLMVSA